MNLRSKDLSIKYIKAKYKGSGEREIEKIYKKFVSFFIKHMGNKATWNSDLDKYGYALIPNFKGTYSMEELNNLPKLKDDESYIINTGDHWVTLYSKNKKLYIYDSFGRPYKSLFGNEPTSVGSPPLRGDYLDKYDKISQNDHDADQGITSETCGQRTLAWLAVVHLLGIKKAKLI